MILFTVTNGKVPTSLLNILQKIDFHQFFEGYLGNFRKFLGPDFRQLCSFHRNLVSIEITKVWQKAIITEMFWYSRKSHYTYSKNNIFMVEFERVDNFLFLLS